MLLRIEVLRYLREVPDALTTELARALGRSQPAIGMSVLRMLRVGLVTRAVDERDLRYYYTLTSKGRARLEYFERRDT